MFGFSLPKLLVLAAILTAVWYGFKFIGRLDQERRGSLKDRVRRAAQGARGKPEAAEAPTAVEDMVQCAVCGVFMPAGDMAACGKPNCPY